MQTVEKWKSPPARRVRRALRPLLLLAATSCLVAQNSSIQGVILDPSEAPVSAAVITLTNQTTGVALITRSNDRGIYAAPLLPSGTYDIAAAKTGFSTATRKAFKLDVGQTARLDLHLAVGAVSESVQVTGTAPLLESETSSSGQVIQNNTIVQMPLNLRNYLELAKFAPGVLPARILGRGSRTGGQDGVEGGFLALGMHAYQTNVLLDGIDNSSRASGGPLGYQAQAVKPPVDSVAEFKVVTTNISAEYGYRMGPKVLVSTKSGDNKLHASLYEFLRNDKFDGANFFANRSGSAKPEFRQNQFGGTVGGPVFRNRTFYFLSYQATRIRRGQSYTSTVPSALTRQGDFSQEPTAKNLVYDPLTTTGTGTAAQRTFFPNSIIPASRFDVVASKIAALYPSSNIAGRDNLASNYFFSPADTDTANQLDLKVDHSFTDRDRTFYRWSLRRDNKLQNGYLPLSAQGGGQGQTVDLPADNLAAGWTHAFGPTVFNEARFGFTHFPTRFDILDTTNLNTTYGILGAPGDTFGDHLDHGLARFTPTGYSEIGSRSFWPNRNWLDNLQFNDNVALQRGAHGIKFGVEWHRSDIFREAQRYRRGQFAFTGVYTSQLPNVSTSRAITGNGFADMLLGWANTTTVGNQLSEDVISPYWGAFVQDDWKLSRRLTVNLGLRWELFQAPYFPQGTNTGRLGVSRYLTEFNVSKSDPRYETFQRPSSGTDCGCEQNYKNFAPRVGFAYRLGENTVIRSGFGLFYGEADAITSESARWVNQTPDFTEVTTNGTTVAQAALVQSGFAVIQLPASSPLKGTSVTVTKDKYPTQYASEWSFDVQRQLPSSLLVSVGYQGSKSTNLAISRNINNPGPSASVAASQRLVRPYWSSVSLQEAGANANYNSLVAKAEKRLSRGLTFIASYTWSHAIDQTEESLDENLSGRASEYNLSAERGNSSLDHRHNFITSYTYDLPFGKGRSVAFGGSRPLDWAFGGWQLGGILTLRTGAPFDVNYPGDAQNSGTRNRGDRTGSGVLANRTIDTWFDQYAFVQSAAGVYGNAGRNVLYGPGQKNFDLLLAKVFPLPWEGHRIQFRAEAFNLTNTANFGQPNSSLRAATTGAITTADDPRRVQFALKYSF
jgi:hypothetical protein